MYHLPFIKWQATWPWFSSEQATIIGHIKFTSEKHIPCISKLLFQKWEIQHLLGNTYVNLTFELHY
ncbi:MAG: hypothetical protein AUI36_27020 [Cyanobacteria bacterium 13_1_40CM_2_61_4]|nr:MAG: hypothetical protein AUI36_27020 [Cyanobacteria bacterium 13_1_40CM_2_61_4]